MHKSRNLVVATVGTLVVAATLAAGGTPASAAASQSFFSSFESTDPQPTWTNTAERSSGVTGPSDRHPRQRHGQGRRGTRERRERRTGEVKENLVDGDIDRSGCVRADRLGRATSSSAAGRRSSRYALTSANDAPGRDPQDWKLQGSNDGTTGRRSTRRPTSRSPSASRRKQYAFANDHGVPALPARHHRQPRRRHHPARRAAALERRRPRRRRRATCAARSATARASGYNAKSGVGLTGVRALQYGGEPHRRRPRLLLQQGLRRRRPGHAATTRAVVHDLPGASSATTCATRARTRRSTSRSPTARTCSDLGAIDQHGADAEPAAARARRRRSTRTSGTTSVSRIGDVAAGKTIDRILVAYDNPDGPGRLRRLDRRHRRSAAAAARRARTSVRLGRHHARHELQRQLLARQQLPRDRRAARLQLLDAGDQRGLDGAGSTSTSAPTTRTTCRRCRRSRSATSRARGWATGRRSR